MNSLNNAIHTVTAFAPATCANVAVGFDILGFAFDEVGDYVTLTRRADNNIVIEAISGAENLPLSPDKNTASFVIQKLCQDLQITQGFSLQIKKGIPLSSGMGGSAASAVAALVAFNAFLTKPLSTYELAQYAVLGEELVSGQRHADNVVPCIFGGMNLVYSLDPIAVVQLPVPDVYCVLIHPHLNVSTKQARKILTNDVKLSDAVKQSANLAVFIAALYSADLTLIKKSLTDILIEPQRAHLVPGFYNVKQAALGAGALGVSFSGSGPSIFAFVEKKSDADAISQAMQHQLQQENIQSDSWIAKISNAAARVTATS